VETKFDLTGSTTTEEHLRSSGYVNNASNQPHGSLNLEQGFIF